TLCFAILVFISQQPRPPLPSLFPYTTLFRSRHRYPTRGDPPLDDQNRGGPPHSGGGHRGGYRQTGPSLFSFYAHSHRCESGGNQDRKSTRLNSSHVKISYAVFCLKKKI